MHIYFCVLQNDDLSFHLPFPRTTNINNTFVSIPCRPYILIILYYSPCIRVQRFINVTTELLWRSTFGFWQVKLKQDRYIYRGLSWHVVWCVYDIARPTSFLLSSFFLQIDWWLCFQVGNLCADWALVLLIWTVVLAYMHLSIAKYNGTLVCVCPF